MTHSVRTAFGDSQSTYRGDTWYFPIKPIQKGFDKVNSASPYIWAILSTPIINCLREAGRGSAFK